MNNDKLLKCQSIMDPQMIHRCYTDDIHVYTCSVVFVVPNCPGEAPAEYLDLAAPDNPDQWNRPWSSHLDFLASEERKEIQQVLSPG